MLDESTKALLTAIAENEQKVYDNGHSDGYSQGRTEECSELSDAIRDVLFAPNLFDKDNYVVLRNWNSGNIKITDTGLQWTNLSSTIGGGYLYVKLGLAKDYAGKILTLSTKQFYSVYTNLMVLSGDLSKEIFQGYAQLTTTQQKNGYHIHRIELAKDGYTDEVIVIRFYFNGVKDIVFDEIMVHDHYDAFQPYVPYGYKPTINAQDYSTKISEIYNKGVTDAKIEAMRLVQGYGSRTNYAYAFYSHRDFGYWNTDTFYPQYDIKGTSFSRTFAEFGMGGHSRVSLDLSARLEECGVVLDTSEATTLASCFGSSTIKRVPTLDCRNCEDNDGVNTVFGYCSVETVDKMIVKRTQRLERTFLNTPLVNISFEGEIGRNISFSTCKDLTVNSVMSAFLHLVDYTGTSDAGKYTITLHDNTKTAMANLGAIPEFNNKTYDAYLTDIGWNLA